MNILYYYPVTDEYKPFWGAVAHIEIRTKENFLCGIKKPQRRFHTTYQPYLAGNCAESALRSESVF
jgi:hypothetical protein